VQRRSFAVFRRLSDTCVKMSDMASNRITVRLPEALTSRLRSRSRSKGQTESKLVREALEQYLCEKGDSAYDFAEEAGIIGVVETAPKGLSTKRQHFKDFGKGK